MSLLTRILAALKRPDSPPRYVIKDAVWVVPSTEYIDPRPCPTGSLFDNPDLLKRSWDATLQSFRDDAALTDEEWAVRAAGAQARLDQARATP